MLFLIICVVTITAMKFKLRSCICFCFENDTVNTVSQPPTKHKSKQRMLTTPIGIDARDFQMPHYIPDMDERPAHITPKEDIDVIDSMRKTNTASRKQNNTRNYKEPLFVLTFSSLDNQYTSPLNNVRYSAQSSEMSRNIYSENISTIGINTPMTSSSDWKLEWMDEDSHHYGSSVDKFDALCPHNIKYCVKDMISSDQSGTVCYEGYREPFESKKFIIKVLTAQNAQLNDAHNEFRFNQALAKKQLECANVNEKFLNVVHVVKTKAQRRHGNREYVIVMDYYPGSLRDLIEKQLQIKLKVPDSASLAATYGTGSSHNEYYEHMGMRLTINLLRQCVAALKQLHAVYPDLKYNNWTPDNILISDINIPISDDIVYTLSGFGKTRRGKHAFGSAPYVSAVSEPKALETQDINSMAVIGIEVLSVFGSLDNTIWEAIEGAMEMAMVPSIKPFIRGMRIRDSISDRSTLGYPFYSATVTRFFQRLCYFTMKKNANFTNFEKFLNDIKFYKLNN